MRIDVDLSQIDANNTIILANNRQIIAFKRTWQEQKGVSQLPKVFSWQGYLQQTWKAHSQHHDVRLLSGAEIMHLWRGFIQTQQKITTQLLREVLKNYDYTRNHLISTQTIEQSNNPMGRDLCQWLKRYEQYKHQQHLVDLHDVASELMGTPKIEGLCLYGFKTLTPLQEKVLGRQSYQRLDNLNQDPQLELISFDEMQQETQQVAQWAEQLHLQQPKASIVVVVPDLQTRKDSIIRIFDQVFNAQLLETHDKGYNLSLGRALSEYPLIQTLLSLFELSQQIIQNKIQTTTLAQALSSVYVGQYQQEKVLRLLLRDQIRTLEKSSISTQTLQKYLDKDTQIASVVAELTRQTLPKQSLGKWGETFNQWMRIWGFASDRALSSVEYQLLKKYTQSLLELNKLSAHNSSVGINQALKTLQQLLQQLIFQAQSGKNQVQVLGALEAQGLRFDHAWVVGMSANFLPEKLNTSAFISSGIATEHQIPYSSYELIHADAKKTLDALQRLAPKVYFSYAKRDGELTQLPSPLLSFEAEPIKLATDAHPSAQLQRIEDARVSAWGQSEVSAGVNLLKDQIACAFKGFAQRLQIQSFKDPHLGLDRAEQGQLVHRTLEYIYQDIRSHQQLMDYSESELETLVREKIKQVLQHYSNNAFSHVEALKIHAVVMQFIDKDKQREDFQVLSTEQALQAEVSGLKFNIKLDRVDQMANGDRIIFDYKTGQVGTWCGAHMSEVQLPIYATTTGSDGAALIHLSADEIKFTGLARDKDSLPKGVRTQSACQDWDAQIKTWHTQLQQASNDFQAGKAEVLPNKKACDYCDYELLCRVQK